MNFCELDEDIEDTVEELQESLDALTLESLNTDPIDADGYVYVIEYGGFHKIGKSIDPYKRVKQFTKVLMPLDFKIEFNFPCLNSYQAEKTLHQYFNPFRAKGEWFKLSEKHLLIAKISIIIESGYVPHWYEIIEQMANQQKARLSGSPTETIQTLQ